MKKIYLLKAIALVACLLFAANASAVVYDLYVAGVQVNDANRYNVLGDGTVAYNPNTRTLTLNEANITAHQSTGITVGDWFDNAGCTIKLMGHNTIASDDYGIKACKSTIITGSGSLDMDNGIRVMSGAPMVIEGGCSIYAVGVSGSGTETLTVNGADTQVKLSFSMSGFASLTLNDGLAIILPQGGYYDTFMGQMKNADGTRCTTGVLICSPMRGDVNVDGAVNIADVTALIDYLLNGDYSNVSLSNADCNKDDFVNIADVTSLIDYLLSGAWPSDDLLITVNGVRFKMVAVEGGTFTMGATAEQSSYASANEFPAHQVTLFTYYIGETEVTQALWEAVMESNPSHFTGDLNCPVESFTWDDCHAFITKLNQMTGRSFRLPTEAEWEYAARGGNKSLGYVFSGSNVNYDFWFIDNSNSTTHPVATKKANELGLYDMSGNVTEWCQDWFGNYSSEAQTNPTGPSTGSYHVGRGGSIAHGAVYCRVSSRTSFWDSGQVNYLGLRLAL